jgi:primosomal protein N'
MELSTQQQDFYNKITSLDFDKILLTGEGGTGKTYVLVKALEALIDAGLNILVCAPTHMARMNLLDKFSYEIRPRVQNKTVASALKRFGFKAQDGSLAFVPGTGDALDA